MFTLFLEKDDFEIDTSDADAEAAKDLSVKAVNKKGKKFKSDATTDDTADTSNTKDDTSNGDTADTSNGDTADTSNGDTADTSNTKDDTTNDDTADTTNDDTADTSNTKDDTSNNDTADNNDNDTSSDSLDDQNTPPPKDTGKKLVLYRNFRDLYKLVDAFTQKVSDFNEQLNSEDQEKNNVIIGFVNENLDKLKANCETVLINKFDKIELDTLKLIFVNIKTELNVLITLFGKIEVK